jgi:hypothetical protein
VSTHYEVDGVMVTRYDYIPIVGLNRSNHMYGTMPPEFKGLDSSLEYIDFSDNRMHREHAKGNEVCTR